MLCSNQAMIAAGFAFVADEPPVVVDWLPWSHTFGSNHNFNMVLVQRRLALYRRRQSDAAGRAEDRAQSARDRAHHLFQRAERLRGAGSAFPRRRHAAQEFLQPAEGAVLCRRRPQPDHLGRSDAARDRDHRRAHYLFVLARLDRDLAAGARLLLGFRPAGQYRAAGAGRRTQAGAERRQAGSAPARPAHHARLLAAGAAHARGLRRGRLLQDRRRAEIRRPRRSRQGLLFDGRIAEDYKLSTGTWVSVGPLRARFIDHFAPYVRDVVFAGPDRDDIVALVFPDIEACRKLAPEPAADAAPAAVLDDARCAREIREPVASAGGLKPRLIDARRARHPDGGAALHGQRRDDRQGLDQSARGA